MIKHILSVGDSFTYGEELPTQDLSYSCVLALQYLNASINNLAKPGSGNKRMIRTVMEEVSLGKPIDLVIIGWSSPGRMEFADDDGPFDIWPGYSGNMFRRDGQTWRADLLDYINKYHNSKWLYQQYLQDIIMMQSFLTQHNIKYLMLTTVANEYYHNIYYPRFTQLTNLIDTKYFVGWPTEGMAEWTTGCKKGPNGHFLEEGHAKVADKLYEHIRNLGWIS